MLAENERLVSSDTAMIIVIMLDRNHPISDRAELTRRTSVITTSVTEDRVPLRDVLRRLEPVTRGCRVFPCVVSIQCSHRVTMNRCRKSFRNVQNDCIDRRITPREDKEMCTSAS